MTKKKSNKKSKITKGTKQLLSFKFNDKNNVINDTKNPMAYNFSKIPDELYKGLYKKLIHQVYQHMKIEPEDKFVTDTLYVKDTITKKKYRSSYMAKKIMQDSSLMIGRSKFPIMTILYFTKVPKDLENANIGIYKRTKLTKKKFKILTKYKYVLDYTLPIKEKNVYIIKPNTYYGFPNVRISSDSKQSKATLEYLYSFCQYA